MVKNKQKEQASDLGDNAEKSLFETKSEISSEVENVEPIEKSAVCARKSKRINLLLLIIILVLCGLVGYDTYQINYLKEYIDISVKNLSKVEPQKEEPKEENIYVYNMEAVLMQTGLADENRKFEADMTALEKEIDQAERKVRAMKNKKLQREYRDMYMKSLTLKRDNIIEEHEKFMKSLLKNTNKALAETAKESNIKVIFSNKAVIYSTNYVTDVTPIVAAKLKEKME